MFLFGHIDLFCNLPYIFVENVGCIYVEIEKPVDFTTAKTTACHGPSYFWYPKNSDQALHMRNYINLERESCKIYSFIYLATYFNLIYFLVVQNSKKNSSMTSVYYEINFLYGIKDVRM